MQNNLKTTGMESKFKIGDKCVVVKYGCLVWERKSDMPYNNKFPIVKQDETYRWIDVWPELVGLEVVITEYGLVSGTYSTNLFSWASNTQLQLIDKTE
jgi:hypothetical protein